MINNLPSPSWYKDSDEEGSFTGGSAKLMFFQSDNLQKLIRTINRNQNEVTNYKHMYSRRIINIWKHFQCALPILSYYSIQINNKNTLISTSVYFNLNEFKDGSWITKMGWATKLLLTENRKPIIPSSKRTMISGWLAPSGSCWAFSFIV